MELHPKWDVPASPSSFVSSDIYRSTLNRWSCKADIGCRRCIIRSRMTADLVKFKCAQDKLSHDQSCSMQ